MNYTRYSIELINSNPTFEKRTIGDCTLSLGHTFIGCEIDPVHFDVACRRIEAYYTMMK